MTVTTDSVCVPVNAGPARIEYQLLEPFSNKYRFDYAETAGNVGEAITWARNMVAKSPGLRAVISAYDDDRDTTFTATITA